MSNPNPFLPKGSLLEQQSKRRSRLKVAVFCTVSVGVVGLVAMLIQGCKRDTSLDIAPPDLTTNSAPDQSLNPPMTDTNPVPLAPSNSVPVPPPMNPLPPQQPLPPVTPPATVDATGGSTYTIVKGDTLGRIARKNGVSLKALEAANPGVDSRHLHVGKTVVIPAGGTAVGSSVAAPNTVSDETDTGSRTSYTVKSGDTLHRIAKKFHVSVKAIEAANHLTTTSIKVGKKLKIPVKAETAPAAPAAPVAAPAVESAPASAVPMNTVPAPAPMSPPASTTPPATPGN